MEIGNSETHSNITPRLMIHTSQEICNGPATIPFDSIPSQKCCAICHYSLCFSTIMSCKYWSDSTLSAITEHGISFGYNEASKIGKIYSPDHLPDSINIYDAVVQISYNAQKYDTLQLGSITSKQVLKNLIMMNIENNTGFFMWVSNFNISCIFQDDQKRMTKYFLVTCNETQTINVFKELGNVDLLVDNIFNIVFGKRDCEQVQYKINFLSCVCDLTKSERQRIMRKHRSGVQKRLRGDKRKECHKNLEPEAKKRFLEKCASNYANMDAKKKLLLCEKNKQKYSSMDSSKKEALVKANKEKYLCITQIEKEIMSQANKEKYSSMNEGKKKGLVQANKEKYKSLRKVEKETLVEANKKKYESMTPVEKESLLQANKKKYESMTPVEKETLLQASKKKYESMTPVEKEALAQANKEKYGSQDPIKKGILLEKMRETYSSRKSSESLHCLDHYISKFHSKISDGPYYICSVCNRLLYRKSVILLNKKKYINTDNTVFTDVKSFDKKQYICKTCQSKLLKNIIPCQATCNDMYVDEIPTELSSLEKLEQILIAQRIVFEKIVVMPKGQQRKVKGAICNVPVECDNTCKVLPRPPERSGIIMLKLKRKLQFRGHVYFQAVRPEFLLLALNWLKLNNPLYSDIRINIQQLSEGLTTIGQDTLDTNGVDKNGEILTENILQNDNKQQVDDNEETRDDPLNEYRQAPTETCLQPVLPDYPVILESNDQTQRSLGSEVYNIAPGENRYPVSIMTDNKCEELAFPALFPKGRFGYRYNRKIKLTPVKYFNARLLHYSGRFAMNPEYLFFAQFVMEQKKVSDSINIALKKVHGQAITASQVKSDVNQLKGLICQDQAYLFLRQIPGTPPYWQKFMYEVVAMVKQLGIPTWFMTLSCADLRWPELFQIIARTQGQNMTDQEVEALSYTERCSMLNLNPVIVAKHFQHRVETFFTEILLSQLNPIGKIIYYALRIEFQMRGSPHLHALIWTSDCPKLDSDNKEAYINFIDNHVQAHLPDQHTEPELYQLVKMYQKHSHSKTCRKYKNASCRFNFGQFFTNRTIIAEPLDNDLDCEIKARILDDRIQILASVKQKINEVLNPSNSHYDETLSEKDTLDSPGITEDDYYWALSVSPDSYFDLHLKRPVDSCFINNYFVAGIKGFAANVDLQPVFNHYKCITYVCSYFTKDETECSQAIVNAAKEAKAENMNIRDGLKKIGAAFLSTREVSAQECVYRSMPELWLRKIFPKTVFVSTDFPEKRLRVTKTQEELNELEDDSTDIYKSNIIERYSIRATNVNKLCLATFAAYYYKDYRKNADDVNDTQPEVLTDDLTESHSTKSNETECFNLPKKIKLINTNEHMKCRKIKAVIRYHRPNKQKELEAYFHHLLMLYYPWRDESSLMAEDQTYATKFYEPGVQTIVEHNRAIFEPDADAIDEAFECVRTNLSNICTFDAINDQENADLRAEMQDTFPNESFNQQPPSHFGPAQNSSVSGITSYNQPTEIADDTLRRNVRSLNTEQRHAYDTFFSWCRSKMKNLNSLKPVQIEPIYLFITGGGGAGKSHLIKTIYHTAVKTFRHPPINPELPTVLLMAPTGVAAINIDGTTINTALAIPKETGDNLPAMSDQKKTQLRLSLVDLKLIIIDEISMVGNTTLLHVHQRLKEIFATPSSLLFAGISIIVVGDLCQLPPIRKRFIFDQYKNELFNLIHPWHVFKMIELTQIMRQKDDQSFIQLLNRVRTGTQTEDDIRIIQSRSITTDDPSYPSDALHIWAENTPVDGHNKKKLEELPGSLYILKAKDQYPTNVRKQDIDRVLARGRSETGGLDYEIHIKEGGRVMLTTNICIADRLINGQMGTIVRIQTNQNTANPTILYIKFDDPNAGKDLINTKGNCFAKENHAVPIEPVLAKIKIRPGKASSPEIQRVQFPVTLAWACTVHKVQGLTLDEVVLSTELVKQRSFNYGQIYVALSRATSLNGLYILGKVESKHIKTNPKVLSEYQRLNDSLVSGENVLHDSCNVFTISLLNVRSLRKHSIDIKHDSKLFNSDVLAFTETQLLPQECDTDIVNDLCLFTLYRQDHNIDKYSSMAVCTRNTVEMTNRIYYPQINALKFDLSIGTSHQTRTFLLLYRNQSLTIPQYLNNLHHVLNTYRGIDVVFGHFNINYFNDSELEPLRLLMDSYSFSQVLSYPTFISGSLLDHVYVKTTSLIDVLENIIISIYYSDHDGIRLTIKY